MLRPHAVVDPRAVAKHQDIRASNAAAVRARRHVIHEHACIVIDLGKPIVSGPDVIEAAFKALHAMDRAMAFDNPRRLKSRLLERPVDIRREDVGAIRDAARDLHQDC